MLLWRRYVTPKHLRIYPTLHPLSGLTDVPFVRLAQGGYASRHLHELHKTHHVIRTGPNTLSYGAPEALKDIYGHVTACVKDRFYSETPGSHAYLADVVDKAEPARKRKALSSVHAIKNLEEWEGKAGDMTRRLIEVFDNNCTKPLLSGVAVPKEEDLTIDYRAWTNYFTMAAIANTGLSEDLGFLEQGNDKIRFESMGRTTKQVAVRECREASGTLSYRPIWAYAWFHILKRLGTTLSPYYRKLNALDADSNEDVYNPATTRPRCLERLRDELDDVLVEEVVAPYSKVKRLPYLRACIDEGLPMLPPVIMSTPRRTMPEGASILGEFIAGDTWVSMPAYVVRHDEPIFKDHDSYQPKRWLGEDGKALQSHFVSFSTGARACTGRNISYLEQTVLLASLWDPPIPKTTNLSPGPMPLKIWRGVRSD
ncbi:cytochrome P450 [Aspergillus undulatus]|uniref:cytochrome P450 n=1 Tax=Aspergillus undulatus TaxID=1810928 RepID=UPI003CCDCE83